MRTLTIFAAALACIAVGTPALAAEPAAVAASAEHAKPKYTTADTEIGTLLDDPKAKAIIAAHIPGLVDNDQIEMARSMTLKVIQTYAPNDVTDARLAAIDAEFAKLN